MPKESDFHSTAASLWFRLITLGIVGLGFAETLILAQGEVQGWTYYLTTAEVVFEVAVRLIFASLAGVALGTLCTAALAPFLWHFRSSRERIAEWATKVGVVLVLFLDSRFALTILTFLWRTNFGPRFFSALFAAHFLAFAAVLSIPRARKEVVTSLDGCLGEKMTRRTAIATVVGAVGLVATEFAFSKTVPVVKAALVPQRSKSNILLITFDVLSAEDMSLYGYGLPTTPMIDDFARKGTVFKNLYSVEIVAFTAQCDVLHKANVHANTPKRHGLPADTPRTIAARKAPRWRKRQSECRLAAWLRLKRIMTRFV